MVSYWVIVVFLLYNDIDVFGLDDFGKYFFLCGVVLNGFWMVLVFEVVILVSDFF